MTHNKTITQASLFTLWAQTPLHVGSGAAISAIDLPIQREGHNGLPCIFGSSLKGALRAHGYHHGDDRLDSVALFGPTFGQGTDVQTAHAGALMVSDARLLLLPVRSLTGSFKWVTSLFALKRLARDARRLGLSLGKNFDGWLKNHNNSPKTETLLCHHGNDSAVFLEEYRFTVQCEDLAALCETLSALSGIECQELQQRLVIVDDDSFTFLSEAATTINPHIAIDSEHKTAKSGALWHEETLPPETVLYSCLLATKSRVIKKGDQQEPQSAQAMMDMAQQLLPDDRPYLQVGGNETVGMGWCECRFFRGQS